MKTPRPLLCLTSIIAAMLFAAGCQRAAITESTDPKEAVTRAYGNLKAARSYYFKHDDISGASREIYRETKESYWSKSVILGHQTETIRLGDVEYTKINAIPWLKGTGRTGKAAGANVAIFFELEDRNIATLSNFKFVEKNTLSGKPALLYTYNSSGGLFAKKEMSEKIWISLDTGLPLKIERGQSGITGESTVFDYEKKVKLEPPI